MILNEHWEENEDLGFASRVGMLLVLKKVVCVILKKQTCSDTRTRIKMEGGLEV